jgi:hypothetical protein
VDLVTHICPDHGPILEASPKALVEHGFPKGSTKLCGLFCAPEGVAPKDHKRSYFERARSRVAMRNIRSRTPLSQANPDDTEPPLVGALV